MDTDQALNEYVRAENDLYYIRRKYRNAPDKLKNYEPVAVFNLRVAELVLEEAQKDCDPV